MCFVCMKVGQVNIVPLDVSKSGKSTKTHFTFPSIIGSDIQRTKQKQKCLENDKYVQAET